MITTNSELTKLIAKAKTAEAIALDTEFVWERTYYPQLGLIQLAISNEECFLIDPVAIQDLRPLGELLADRSVVKIFHDAPQDLALLYRATGIAPQNIFDTRLAAGFSCLSSTLSLGSLIQELLDISLPKTETRTNWLQRPLTTEQIEYAMDDVRYLQAIRILLLNRIIGPKIRSWLQEELNLLNNPKNYTNNTINRFLRIRGVSSLSKSSLYLLKTLAEWREETAKSQDKPRNHIIQDLVLVDIAKKMPRAEEDLHGIPSLSAKAFSRYGKQLVALTQASLDSTDKPKLPQHRILRLSTDEKNLLDRLHKLVNLKSEILGIDPVLIGNTNELKTVVKMLSRGKDQPIDQLRQTEGWRKSFLEDFFHQSR